MKRYISILLVAILLFSCVLTAAPEALAAKKNETRGIGIVFDNSGSMYISGNKAWCQATYAMEVFASMLNDGDILQIYPMNPITVGGKVYTMDSPFQITDAAQASSIREIFTEDAGGTPIESIDCAAQSIPKLNTDKKYMIVLTDGGTFSRGTSSLSEVQTKKELDSRIAQYASKDMKIMYLGIGSSACIPGTGQSDIFNKKHAVNTANVLSSLTEMCNLIFGRDSLPKSRISGKTINFDVSMSKLIVFVQGDNIANLKLTGDSVGTLLNTQQTKYSELGAGDYPSIPDTSLQGMIVTYADCAAGTCDIEYTGTASNIEVYYEPDADLDFVFTDMDGNTVNPNALYEGDYKVSFGIKDAKTGKLIESDLLGKPHYQGSYSINGESHTISTDGYSGEVQVSLKMGDTFDANLTVTYLSGYSITKDSSDFGWPEGGIRVAQKPAGELKLEISGGQDLYTLQHLEEGEPYIAKVYYQGELLTGDALEQVDLKWDPDTSNAEIWQEFCGDHYELTMHYKNPAVPQNTVCGECTVDIYAFYTEPGCGEAQGICPVTYNIEDDFSPLQMELSARETYFVISELENSSEIVLKLKMNGAPLTPEEMAAVELQLDCDGIEHTVTPQEQDSSYLIKLLPTKGITDGKYRIRATAVHTDDIGRATQAEDTLTVTLASVPLWLRWTIRAIALLVLIILIWIISHIKVLPKHMHTTKRLSSLVYDGEDVTQSTNFLAEIRKGSAKIQSQYGGRKFGISMDVKPGKESYLYKPQKRRSAEVKVTSVRKFGPAKIQEVMIGSAKYMLDEDSGKLVPALPNMKPFPLTNGMMIKYSGTIQDAGVDKDFETVSKLNFKKK